MLVASHNWHNKSNNQQNNNADNDDSFDFLAFVRSHFLDIFCPLEVNPSLAEYHNFIQSVLCTGL